MREFNYPVWGTQGGGLVREIGGKYIFVEKPDCPGLDVGDEMPEEWGICPANQQARENMDDQYSFNEGVDLLFDLAFAGVGNSTLLLGDLGELFPKAIRDRNA